MRIAIINNEWALYRRLRIWITGVVLPLVACMSRCIAVGVSSLISLRPCLPERRIQVDGETVGLEAATSTLLDCRCFFTVHSISSR